MLDLDAVQKSLSSLERYYAAAQKSLEEEDFENFDLARTACVQAYEYTSDTAHKMIKRKLEKIIEDPEDLQGMDFRTVMRMGAEESIVSEPVTWVMIRELRNKTSHTYNEDKAQDVFDYVPVLIKEARFLLERLEALNVPS